MAPLGFYYNQHYRRTAGVHLGVSGPLRARACKTRQERSTAAWGLLRRAFWYIHVRGNSQRVFGERALPSENGRAPEVSPMQATQAGRA